MNYVGFNKKNSEAIIFAFFWTIYLGPPKKSHKYINLANEKSYGPNWLSYYRFSYNKKKMEIQKLVVNTCIILFIYIFLTSPSQQSSQSRLESSIVISSDFTLYIIIPTIRDLIRPLVLRSTH